MTTAEVILAVSAWCSLGGGIGASPYYRDALDMKMACQKKIIKCYDKSNSKEFAPQLSVNLRKCLLEDK